MEISFISSICQCCLLQIIDFTELVACWVICHVFCMLIFFKINFLKKFFQEQAVSNTLDPDQDQWSVGSDLGQTVCKGYQQTM